jgi:hypothetical protein
VSSPRYRRVAKDSINTTKLITVLLLTVLVILYSNYFFSIIIEIECKFNSYPIGIKELSILLKEIVSKLELLGASPLGIFDWWSRQRLLNTLLTDGDDPGGGNGSGDWWSRWKRRCQRKGRVIFGFLC